MKNKSQNDNKTVSLIDCNYMKIKYQVLIFVNF